jgi:hypothetical protein
VITVSFGGLTTLNGHDAFGGCIGLATIIIFSRIGSLGVTLLDLDFRGVYESSISGEAEYVTNFGSTFFSFFLVKQQPIFLYYNF